MPYPTRKEVHQIFLNLYDPPTGTDRFFEHVDDNVHWHVTGQHRYSGTWESKQDFYNATWSKMHKLLAEPGCKLTVPGGENGVIVGQDGWAVIEMKTEDTKSKSGVVYDQHYSWHCRFNEAHKIVQVKAFLDADHLEKVFGGEQRIQQSG